MIAAMRESAPRFWSRVNRRGPVSDYAPHLGACWIWQGGHSGNGYGLWRPRRGVTYLAHRFSYETLRGEMSGDLVLDHLCRVRDCVNPDHLDPVTNRENVLRGVGASAINAGKTHCPNGHLYTAETVYASKCRRCKLCGRNRDQRRDPVARNSRRRANYATAKVQKMSRSGGSNGGSGGGFGDDAWSSPAPASSGSRAGGNFDEEPPF